MRFMNIGAVIFKIHTRLSIHLYTQFPHFLPVWVTFGQEELLVVPFRTSDFRNTWA